MLAKGNDNDLKSAAEMEVPTPPAGPEARFKLADTWWDLAQSRNGRERKQILLHAADWYQQARPDVASELLKAKAEKRIKEAAQPDIVAAKQLADHDPAENGAKMTPSRAPDSEPAQVEGCHPPTWQDAP